MMLEPRISSRRNWEQCSPIARRSSLLTPKEEIESYRFDMNCDRRHASLQGYPTHLDMPSGTIWSMTDRLAEQSSGWNPPAGRSNRNRSLSSVSDGRDDWRESACSRWSRAKLTLLAHRSIISECVDSLRRCPKASRSEIEWRNRRDRERAKDRAIASLSNGKTTISKYRSYHPNVGTNLKKDTFPVIVARIEKRKKRTSVSARHSSDMFVWRAKTSRLT